MYGEEGTINVDNIPPAMQWLLNKYKYQIDGLKAGTHLPNYYSPKAVTAVPPMVTANWDQSAPYNNQCPTSGGRRAVTGCPATSLAMCYYKWKWPKTFPAVAAISSSSSGGYSAPALGERQADWDNIIDEYTGPTNTSSTSAQKDAVAWLMRYAGQAIPDYMYGYDASGADDPEIYQGVLNMGYTNAQYLLLTQLVQSGWSYTNGPQQYTDAQWNNYMMTELQAGRPIEYLAYDCSSYQPAGHAFNVFGCDANGKYYVNWGWSGDSNGYCTLHNFTTSTGATGQSGSYVFNYGEAMIIGIAPPAGAMGPELNVNATSLSFTTAGQSNLITLTGCNLTSDVIVALNDPDDAFTLNIVGLNTSNSPMIKGNTTQTIPAASIGEDNPVNIIVTLKEGKQGTFNGTMTLSSTGIDPISISLNANAGVEDTGGTASDAYLNIAKYATIDDAGWRNGNFNYLYKYTETNDGVAWLTLPVYGAWASWYYNKSSGTGNGSGPQRWISSSISSQTSNINGNETWNASSPFVGSSFYFTSNNPPAKYFGNTNGQANSTRTITFYVTNASAVMMFGKNNYTGNGSMNTSRRCSMEITHVDEALNQIQTIATEYGNTNKTATQTLSYNNLDPNKIYRVVLSTMNTHLYEIGFCTPLALPETPVIVSADPGSTTADITWVGGANNEFWNLRYRPYVEPEMETITWDFNTDDQFDNWGILDIDGDNYSWGQIQLSDDDAPADYAWYSESYHNISSTSGTALTPNNWLISPEIQFGGEVSFYAWGLDPDWSAEVFNVLVAPSSAISGTSVNTGQFVSITPDITTTGTKTKYTFDLSAYSGSGYFVIQHHNVTDKFILVVDDVVVKYPAAGQTAAEWIYVNGVTSPYTIEGLTPETTYEVQVQGGNATFGTSSWTSSTLFTTLNGIGVPVIVSADPTATTSDITWTAGENNEGSNLRYRPYVEATMETIVWDFPVTNGTSVATEGWSSIDNDEDGYDWGLMATDGDDNTDPTDACWYSQSFINDVGALTPDNWLVSPEVQLGGSLKFKAWRSQYEGEVLGVFVYQDGNEYLIQAGQDIRPTATETEYEFDLSDFEGTGLIVIAHYNCTDGFYVFVDDIELTYPVTQQAEWIYVNDVESPYTIEGLTPETTYEVQVQGVGDGGATSAWTPSTLFTTLGIVDATLAEIESEGDVGTIYTISDALVAVYANADAGQLWCKDMNASINPSYPKKDDQIDYMREVSCEQVGEWQQNNWVLLQFPAATEQNGIKALLESAAENNSIIKAGSLTGRYSDALNYTIDIDATELVIDGTADYTMNLYCTANFLNSNLNLTPESLGAPGRRHGQDVYYFFMNPKIQEVCEVTYAEWDGEKFVVPSSDDSQIQGAFTVDWSFNAGGPMSPAIGISYRFTAVVQRTPGGFTKAGENNYKVYALDFTEQGSLITGINGIYNDGNRGEVVGVEYVNAAGIVSSTPFKGVNIVVTRYSDGSKTTSKKVFK